MRCVTTSAVSLPSRKMITLGMSAPLTAIKCKVKVECQYNALFITRFRQDGRISRSLQPFLAYMQRVMPLLTQPRDSDLRDRHVGQESHADCLTWTSSRANQAAY